MKTVGQPPVLRSLTARLHSLSREDWQRWAFKHTDHHLRQFGL